MTDELETERTRTAALRDENRRLRVQVLARKLAMHPEAAADLLDWGALGDDADDPHELELALKDLRARKPWIAAAAAGVSQGNEADGGQGRGNDADPFDDDDVRPGHGRIRAYYADEHGRSWRGRL